MMKLYYSTGSCSLAPHIVLNEAGLAYEAIRASTSTHQLDDGTDYYQINSKGYVPLLELDDGQRLTEGPVILQYIADQVPEKALMPPSGTMGRYRQQEWLNFITSELHKGIGGMFNPAMPEAGKAALRVRAAKRLEWVNGQLEGKAFLMGPAFTAADAYLFTIVNWTTPTGTDISSMKHLVAFQARIAARPTVQAAMRAQGLSK